MKRFFAVVLAAVFLLCFAGCTGKQPPTSDDGLLATEALLGTYDVTFQGKTESGSRTVELRLLNERLTFALYPDESLNSEHSFDSYDPKTGKAVLEQSEQNKFTVFCEIAFAKTDGKITFSGNYTITQDGVEEESYTLFGEMIEKI